MDTLTVQNLIYICRPVGRGDNFVWFTQNIFCTKESATRHRGRRGTGFWRSIWSRQSSCEKLGTVIYIGTYVCSMYILIASRATRHYDLTSILCDYPPPPTPTPCRIASKAYNESPLLLSNLTYVTDYEILFIRIFRCRYCKLYLLSDFL